MKRTRVALWLSFSTVLFGSASALAGNKVTVESVNNYAGNGNLLFSIPNGKGFVDAMVSDGTFQRGTYYTDGNVYDTDFVDPARVTPGGDTTNFDRTGDAIAYFTGHGTDQATSTPGCTSSSQCTTPPWFGSGNGTCVARAQGNSCFYNSGRYLVTSSSGNQHGGYVNYSSGAVALGEGTYGPWAGAGSDGGVNLAVFDLSHGVSPMFWLPQLGPLFAGVHLVATLMPVYGDTNNTPDRGSTFAKQRSKNPAFPVARAWTETLNSLPTTSFNTDGCNFVMAMDSSLSRSQYHINSETWSDLTNDLWDGAGASYFTWQAICNYNVTQYPWSI